MAELKVEVIRLQKILIVEDEPDMVLGLKDNFEFEGYEVLVARDGREVLPRSIRRDGRACA